MRNSNLFIILIMCAGIAAACSENFLSTQPLTEVTEETFFRTQEDMEMALVGAYNSMIRTTNTVALNPTRWDDIAHPGMGLDGINQRVMQTFDLTISNESNLYNGDWENAYTAIYRVNKLLQKLDEAEFEWDNPQRRNQIEAEARFIRAHSYYNLVRYFERVVLITEPTDENLPQSDPDATYSLIADDLLFSAENAPSEITSRGKVTNWAAKSLIARVYLFYTGYYEQPDLVGKVTEAQALQGLEDVIASGHFELVPEFKNLWVAPSAEIVGDDLDLSSYAGKDNSEVILAHRHNMEINNPMVTGISNRVKPYPPYGFGWGGLTVKPEFYNSFEENDPRREASIFALVEEGYGDEIDISFQRDYTGYKTKKYITLATPDGTDYVTTQGGSWQNGQHWDYVYMRYADVLLMAAELGSSNAQQYFDMVRDRVGLPSIPATFDNIMNERNFEFAFEGLRYFDLMRQGLDVLAETLAYEGTVLDGGSEYHLVIDPQNIIEKRGFQQIPQEQLNISGGVLEQNPGW